MAVPSAVQRDADAVAAIESAIYEPEAPPPDPLEPPATPPDPEPPPPPPADPPPAPAPKQSAPSPVPEETWEHKYKVLQGMFNSETRKLHEQLRDTTQRLTELEKAKAPPPEPPKKPEADAKDVETFGADMVDMVVRVTERMFGSVARSLDERITKLEATLDTTGKAVAQTAEQAFWSELERLVPDWADVNRDERFLAWLADEDPVYGVPRQVALDRAHQALNARQAAKVFTAWKAMQTPPQPAPVAPPKPSLENQVAPSTAASPPPTPAPAKPIITSKQIERFYNEVAQGKYRGREQEAARLEAEINQALVEGRVR